MKLFVLLSFLVSYNFGGDRPTPLAMSSNKDRKYSTSDLHHALRDIQNGTISYRKASEIYYIPKSTLLDKVKSKYTDGKIKPGPSGKLTFDQEVRLKSYLLIMSRSGFGMTTKEIPDIIKAVLDEAEKNGESLLEDRKFVGNVPPRSWVYRFLARHPDITMRRPENLGYQRAYVTEQGIRRWFSNLKKFLSIEYNIDALEFFSEANSSRVFNLDESGFPLSGTTGRQKIVAMKGQKNIYRLTPDTKEQITVLCCIGADGTFVRPYVIFPGVRPRYNIEGIPDDYFDLGHSISGWISADCFFGWLANLFYPRLKDKVEFPIIVFMDGHSAHINLAVSEFCKLNKIILYCLPAHSSHILQPLDIAVFGPLKKYWNESLQHFSKRQKNTPMSKVHFFPVFKDSWDKALKKTDLIISGFRKSGILPFNPDAVDYSKVIESVIRDPNSTPKCSSYYLSHGVIHSWKKLESCLPEKLKELLGKRFEENYDIHDNKTELDVLWNFYSWLRFEYEKYVDVDSTESDGNAITPVTTPSVATSVMDVHSTISAETINTPITAAPSAAAENNAEITIRPSHLRRKTPTNEVQASTSAEPLLSKGTSTPLSEPNRLPNAIRKLSFSSWNDSPFKKYLKISDEIVLSRKVSKTTSHVPPAVSGEDYYRNLMEMQDKKAKALEDKENRKKAREAKQCQMPVKKNKKLCEEDSASSDLDISEGDFHLESEVECESDGTEECQACGGRDDWSDSSKWLGCTSCPRWFHTFCISDEVASMSKSQLRELRFECTICQKKKCKR